MSVEKIKEYLIIASKESDFYSHLLESIDSMNEEELSMVATVFSDFEFKETLELLPF